MASTDLCVEFIIAINAIKTPYNKPFPVSIEGDIRGIAESIIAFRYPTIKGGFKRIFETHSCPKTKNVGVKSQ